MNLRTSTATIALAAAGALAPWFAMAAADAPAANTQSAAASYATGEVKKIDTEQGKITLKHGPIENLGMPGMMMVFRADPTVLAGVQVGDQVRFKADKVDGVIKVTELTK